MRVVATAGHVDHGKSTSSSRSPAWIRIASPEEKRPRATHRSRLCLDDAAIRQRCRIRRRPRPSDSQEHARRRRRGRCVSCSLWSLTEGWKPPSEEHLRILELLGVSHGVIALTKVGSVDDDTSSLSASPSPITSRDVPRYVGQIVAVDAPSGVGLGALRLALDRLVDSAPAAVDRDRPAALGRSFVHGIRQAT